MKIASIKLSGFRSHLDTDIKGLGQKVLILGPNGSGKSGIMDAIAYALTGACRGTDEGGRGHEVLVSPSCKGSPVIIMETDRGLINRAVGIGPKSQTQEKINGMIRSDRTALRCATRSQAFLDMEAKEQEALLRALVTGTVTLAQAKEALGRAMDGINPAALTTMDGVVQSYQFAYGARAGLKKQLDVSEKGTIAQPDQLECEGQQVSEVEDDVLNAMFGRAKQAIAVMDAAKSEVDRMSWLGGERESLNNRLNELRAKIAPLPTKPELLSQIKALAERKEQEDADALRRRVEADTWMAKAKSAKETISRLQQRIQRLSSMSHKNAACEYCGQTVDQYRLKKIEADLVKDIKEAEQIATASVEAGNRLAPDLADTKTGNELAGLRNHVATIDSAREEAKGIKSRIAEIDGMLKQAPPFSPEAYKNAVTLMARLQDHMNYRISRSKRSKELDAMRQSVELAEATVKALGPGGPVRALHMGDGLASITSEISAISRSLGVGAIEINVSPRWSVMVNGRPSDMLSGSERFRASLAFSIAIAKRTGINMVCLDGADILDDDNRSVLLDMVDGPLGLDQVIISATSTSGDFSAEGWSPVFLSKDERGVTVCRQP